MKELIKTPISIAAGELLARQFKPRDWLIEGLLKERQLALVYAPSGVGKSWFAWSLACMVAGGGKGLHKYSNQTPRKVLIVDGEMDGEDAQERIKVSMESVKTNLSALNENLVILSRQLQDIKTEFPNFNDKGWQHHLIDLMLQSGIEFLVLDNLSTLLQVEDENSSAALDGFTDFLLLLKRAGIGAIVVHHANKAGSSYRGSQKISVTFDLILSLTKPPGSNSSNCSFEVTFEKSRGRIESIPFRVSLGGFGWNTEESDAEAKMAWEALKTGQYKTYQQLADGLGENKSRVHRWIEKAIKAGICSDGDVKAAFARAKFELIESIGPEENPDF